MIRCKKLISTCLLLLIVVIAYAQSGTNSPYTRYGFGHLSDQGFGNSKAMGGLAYGVRYGQQINASNPASYSAVDSLTFLFDAGLSLQNANFKENGVKTNAKNSTFDYLAMQFRLMEGLGLTAGFLPFSSVGYSMNQTKEIGKDEYGDPIGTLSSFSGEGGLQQVFLGLGYNVFNNLSVGANISFLYGDISHTASTKFSNSNATVSMRSHEWSIKDYKLDFGVQYTHNFGKKHSIVLGAVYTLGKDLNGDSSYYEETYNSSSALLSQTKDSISNAFSLPHMFGVGFTYNYDHRLTVGIDYTLQKWADVKFPDVQKDNNGVGHYQVVNNFFANRSKISVGAEYRPNPFGRNYLGRISYRIGAYYSDPYTKVNNQEGAREYGASFGFGLPLFKSKSILNISGQYIKVSPKVKGMLEENYLRVNIGLTFNERWFMKWKVD